jgi:hypothetical protein
MLHSIWDIQENGTPPAFLALLAHLLPDLAETLFLHCPVLTVEV